MKIALRGVWIILLLALFIVPSTAQETDSITVRGSKTVTELLTSLVSSSEVNIDLAAEVTGTSSGFTAFCQGAADITTSNRPINIEEDAACLQGGVTYAEYLIAYDVLAVISNPSMTFAECLSTPDLTTIFAPSAQDSVMTWDMTFIPDAVGPISIFLPADDTTTFALLDSFIQGLGVRADVTVTADDDETIASVNNTPGALGAVRYQSVSDRSDTRIVQLRNAELNECFAPSLETIEQRQYIGAERLFVYVNQASAEKPGLQDFLGYITSEKAAESITAAGYINPSEESYALNQSILAGEVDGGRQFSLEVAGFEIPDSVFGTVNIAGDSSLFSYLSAATGQFNSTYPGVTFNVNINGEPDGLRQLCNDEASIIATTSDLSAEDLDRCASNNITPYTIDLGHKAVVMLANAQDDYLACLTQEQVVSIWGSASTDTTENWNDIDSQFPESKMILVAPREGEAYTDLLLTPAEGAPLPIRPDVAEENRDPLYRAAAVGNTSGTLTFVSWDEYQAILDNNQGNIRLVGVNSGDGCVIPSDETIGNGTYKYAQANKLVVSTAALRRAEVQSFLWYLFSDQNYTLVEQASLTGLNFGDLPSLRSDLQTQFAEALANVPVPDALETIGLPPGVESTAEASEGSPSLPVVEITAEATDEATPEATPESSSN